MESVYFVLKVYLLGFAASIFIAFIIKLILLVIRQFANKKHA
jgi:hypothetical protein